MKQVFVTFLLLMTVLNSQAQSGNTGFGTPTPGSKVTVNGSFAAKYNSVTLTNYTLQPGDYYLSWSGTSKGTVTLPTAIAGAGNFMGRLYNIRNASTSDSLVIVANGSELLANPPGSDVASITLPPGYFALLVSKGTTGAISTWEVAFVSTGSPISCQGFGTRSVSGSQTLTSGIYNKVLFNAKDWDQGNVFTPTTGSFVVPQAGKYLLTATVYNDAASTATAQVITLYKNNGYFSQGNHDMVVALNGNGMVITYISDLAAGDAIDVRDYITGSSSTILAATFSAIRLDCGTAGSSAISAADNGLTVGYNSPGKIGLGGTLGKNTDIATAGYDLTFSGTGNIGIHTPAPISSLDIVNDGGDDSKDDVFIRTYSASTTPALVTYTLSGTKAVPLNVSNGRHIGVVIFGAQVNNTNAQLSAISGYYTGNGSNNLSDLRFFTSGGGTERMRILDNGSIGINTTTTSSLLSVNGSADKVGGGVWGTFSDIRVKQNITAYRKGLKEIMAIHPVSFQYNGKAGYTADGKTYVGVIAQEIEKILPSTIDTVMVGEFKDLRKYDASELTYTLINAIQDLKGTITAQAAKIAALEADMATLQKDRRTNSIGKGIDRKIVSK